jgi:hypothetical protein
MTPTRTLNRRDINIVHARAFGTYMYMGHSSYARVCVQVRSGGFELLLVSTNASKLSTTVSAC